MFKNITELLVEAKLDSMLEKSDCCKCEKCRDDIMAYALNRLPPKYISTEEGELFAKVSTLSEKYNFDVIKAIAMAIEVVSNHPRH